MTLRTFLDANEAVPTRQERRAVTLLSGFLGSGKTTLLRRELDRDDGRQLSVVLNDYGQSAVDDALLTVDGVRPSVLAGGCVCCTRREDLASALVELLDADQRADAPTHDHVVIETSGLADPAPVAFTIANDPVLKHHYALDRICVTVDAVTGLDSIQRHDVAHQQLLAADDVLVTKSDLVAAERVDALVRSLRQLNPSARVRITAMGAVVRTEPPGRASATQPSTPPTVSTGHAPAVSTLEMETREPLDWQAFSTWLTLLLHRHGPDVLRVKGRLNVDGVGPVSLNGVQHTVYKPEHLDRDDVRSDSRLVFIVQNMDTALLARSLRAFLALP